MKVSVVIPCYNAEAYVAQTIGSVIEQTRTPEEIIIVDDGSTDQSVEIARQFGSRLQILSQENAGASEARNYGASVASGDALMFLDADDVLGPTALEALSNTLMVHPESIAVCPWYRLEHIDGTWVRQPPSCDPRRPDQDDLSAWLCRWYHPPCSVLWSRSVYERTGGWDQRAYVNDDGEIMMRAFVLGASLAHASGGEAFYRRLPGSLDSVSGARFSRAGRESQIYVILKIARMLEERDMLPDYHAPLANAFERIATECKTDYPDLYARCMHYLREYGNIRGMRSIQRSLTMKMDHLAWWIAEHTWQVQRMSGLEKTSEGSEPPERIDYGLETARQVQMGKSDISGPQADGLSAASEGRRAPSEQDYDIPR